LLSKFEGIPLASSIACRGVAASAVFKIGGDMLWVLAILMGGLGVGYVTVRRKRKAEPKRAA
jgi:hypothetical protein